LFVGGWAINQLWLFIVAPVVGAMLAAGVFAVIQAPGVPITTKQAERALASESAERGRTGAA